MSSQKIQPMGDKLTTSSQKYHAYAF